MDKIKEKWNIASEVQYLARVNSASSSNYLVLFQPERNVFQYAFCKLNNDGKFYHNWSYYTNKSVVVMPKTKAMYCFNIKDIPFEKCVWNTFLSFKKPKNKSLVIFQLLLDYNDENIYGDDQYNLGYFYRSWLKQEYFKPSINSEILQHETICDSLIYNNKNYCEIIKSLKKYSKINFDQIYKWIYLSDILNLIGDPLDFKMGIKECSQESK